MSDNKIMPWIDELEGAAATDFPARGLLVFSAISDGTKS